MKTGGLLTLAVIEEAAKMIFPVAIFIRGNYHSEVDGLLFGTASGMGFTKPLWASGSYPVTR